MVCHFWFVLLQWAVRVGSNLAKGLGSVWGGVWGWVWGNVLRLFREGVETSLGKSVDEPEESLRKNLVKCLGESLWAGLGKDLLRCLGHKKSGVCGQRKCLWRNLGLECSMG